jgi:hypothetical protein
MDFDRIDGRWRVCHARAEFGVPRWLLKTRRAKPDDNRSALESLADNGAAAAARATPHRRLARSEQQFGPTPERHGSDAKA